MNKSEPLSSSSSSVISKQAAWPWPYYCHNRPRTLSFRIPDDIFKTINSAYILDTPSSSSSSLSPSSSPPSPPVPDASLESVIRSARSDRIFFDPGATSSSILHEASSSRLPIQWTAPGDTPDAKDEEEDEGEHPTPLPYSDSVLLSLDSRDPVNDFRVSMEEMVVAHSLKDWDLLEELLQWYLKVNDEANHSYVYGAFLDLLVRRAFVSGKEAKSPSSSSSSSCECLADSSPVNVPRCGRNYSPSSPLSLDTMSTSTSSSSVGCIPGQETEEYDKLRCSVVSFI
ncbi:hypothetical protein MLD38_016102 [Melastoma candidum]|uniref:Uncharacterized protein n=1 Tax=Melastoma candidum TaxID=119954 RepID=A0ACB9RLE6_9MYRT|nr:hypothetical protein MLD38_016102 [Melastoma candidum]